MISKYIEEMTDEDLATSLKYSGVTVGPITATTRLVYERKLARIQQDNPPAGQFGDIFNCTLQQTSTMSSEDIKEMTNEDLAAALKNSGVTVGPITATTRLVYERKLARIQQDSPPSAEEDEEMEEEQNEPEPVVYEEKSTERSYDLSTKLTRSVARRLRDASPPPDINLDKLPGSAKTKNSRKQRGKTQKKLSPEEKPSRQRPNSVPEKVNLPNHSIQSFASEMKLPEEIKPLPKSKLKSNIPRSSRPDYTNSTVIYPNTRKAPTQRRSFGLSDSYHIPPTSSSPERNAEPSSEKEHHANGETFEVNETDSDGSVDNPQNNDVGNQFTDSPQDSDYDDHSPYHCYPTKNYSDIIAEYSPRENYDFNQEMDSSESEFNNDESTRQSEKFSSRIPNRWSTKPPVPADDLTTPVFKKPDVPPSRIAQPKSLDKAQRSKKSSSIWKLDPVEEKNIHRGMSEIRSGSANSSVKYDYLPKAFVEKYGKYMNKSGTDKTDVKNHQSIDSLIFQSHREQTKSSIPNSVAQVKAEKLTSAYQRFTSPLASKISGGNNPPPPPTYIGTPGSSQLNTSLTRKPLSSMREEVKFTSLRNSQAGSSASAASAPKKKGMSIMVKLLILIVFGLIVWLIYINFESPATKPLLTSNH